MSELPRPFTVTVTLGTDHHQFPRLLNWVAGWALDQDPSQVSIHVQMQTGPTSWNAPTGLSYEATDYLPHERLIDWFAQSDAVVAQGGPGGMMDIRSVGLMPLLVPRRSALKEHVDDHQVAFCREMDQSGVARCLETEIDLRGALSAVLNGELDIRTVPRDTRSDVGTVVAGQVAHMARLTWANVRSRGWFTVRNLRDHRFLVP